MAQEFRREFPRQPADWFGFYRFDSERNEPWRCCRVIDVSPAGAGLELFDTATEDSLDGLLTVSVELRGVTRNVVFDEESHSARVGVQFPTPTEAAKDYIRSLNGTRSRW